MMLSTLVFLSAMGDAMPQSFTCDDPAFTLMVEDGTATLQGTVTTPQRGYTASLKLRESSGDTLAADLVLAQDPPKSGGFGRGLPALETVSINQRFAWPAEAVTLRFFINGLSATPKLVLCQQRRQG